MPTTDELALAQGERRYRAIFEQAAVGVAQVATDGRWMDVNRRLCEFLGYTSDELRSLTFQDITHPDDLDTDMAYVRRMLAGEISTYTMEKRYRRKGGAFIWANLTVSLVRGELNDPLYFISVVEDIDARKQAEARLADAAANISLMVKASNIGLWDWDLSTNRVHFSREWKGQLGYGDHEIADDFGEWERRVHPDDLAATVAQVQKQLADPSQPHEVEFRMRHKDGSWRWILTRAEVSRDASGRPIRMLGCHIDITDRKLGEWELAESERRFRSLVEGADVIVWEADPATHDFTYVSPQAARLGYPLKDWYTPQFWYNHTHPDDRDWAQTYCLGETKAGRNHQFNFRMLAADGRTVWLKDVVNLDVPAGGKEPSFLRGVLIDITESKRQAELKATAREREAVATIAAGVAHEFNSLLMAASIQMHRHATRCHVPGDATCGAARDLVEQARSLAAALLDLYSGPERGEPTSMSLYPWLPETVARLGVAMPSGIRVTAEVEFDLPEVIAHSLGLEQVLRNLLFNAADALGEAGEVRVRATSAAVEGQSKVEVRVSDDGPGIPEALRANVFEPGFSTKPASYRSGLGLAIAGRLLEQFGGSIAYEPNTPKGSTFVVRLRARSGEAP